MTFKNPFKARYRAIQALCDRVTMLCLDRQDEMLLPPFTGCNAYGPIRISGTSVATINYAVWDDKKDSWGFVEITVQAIRQQKRFVLSAKYSAKGVTEPANKQHLKQFWKLAKLSERYWPLLPKPIANIKSGVTT